MRETLDNCQFVTLYGNLDHDIVSRKNDAVSPALILCTVVWDRDCEDHPMVPETILSDDNDWILSAEIFF